MAIRIILYMDAHEGENFNNDNRRKNLKSDVEVSLLPTIKPEFFKRYPGVVYYILVFTIAGYFTSQFVNISKESRADCSETVNYLKTEMAKKDSQMIVKDNRIYDLQQQLLISNGIIEKLPEKLDSISRSRKSK